MADDTNKDDIGEELRKAYLGAPQAAREYIDSGKLEGFVGYLRERMSLSSQDVIKVTNELLLSLLGITSPSMLVQNLAEGQLMSEPLATAVASEAQKTIFNDLQNKSQEGEKNVAVSSPGARPAAVVPPPAPINRLAAPAKPVAPVVAPVPPPAPVVPVTPPKTTAPIVPVAAPKLATSPMVKPVVPPPAKLPAPASIAKPVVPALAKPAVVPPPSSIMKMPTAPKEIPAASLKPSVPVIPSIVAPRPSAVVEKKQPAPTDPKHISSASKADPYREPIE